MKVILTFDVYENRETKLDEYHSENWKNDIPTESEIAQAIVNECDSWLSDLNVSFSYEIKSESSLEEHLK
jgi:hypothetical protein